MSQSDRTLARRLVAGDASALDRFFEDQVPRLYRFARRRLGSRQDLADEVVQEALVKIIDKLDSFRGDSALSTWMCTICWRVIQDWRVRDRRFTEIPIAGDDRDLGARGEGRTISGEAADPEAACLLDESVRRVHEVLDALPSPYGDALEWKYIEGQSVKEIARRLGVSPKAAESTLARARIAFRKAFEADPASSFTGGELTPS